MKQMEEASPFLVNVLCCLGLFIAGYIFYSSSLIESFFAPEFHLTSWSIGIAQASVPLGAIMGAVLAGRLSDFFGRRHLLVWNFFSLILISLGSIFIFDFYSLCFSRILSGFLAGTLYPLCAAYMTEMTPKASLARQSAILMFINCLAAPVASIVAMLLSIFFAKYLLWRFTANFYILPSVIAYLLALKLPESREWLMLEDKISLAKNKNASFSMKVLFNKSYRHMTICLLGAWFLMDVAYYGINFFVPYLLQMMNIKSFSLSFVHPSHSLLNDENILGTFIINLFFMFGALGAVFIVEKINLFQLQKYGFLFASMSLLSLAFYFYSGLNNHYFIIFLFVIFNLALNLGPDVTTYLLSATSYPVEMRGSGHGLNAGFAKFGSFLGVLLLPKIQDLWGYQWVILLLAISLFIAYILTIFLSNIILNQHYLVEANVIYDTN